MGGQGEGPLEASRRKQTLPGPPTLELAVGLLALGTTTDTIANRFLSALPEITNPNKKAMHGL
jgi:hypothetical protein